VHPENLDPGYKINLLKGILYYAEVFFICLACLLASCNTPKVGFRYSGQQTQTIGKNTFIVYFNKTKAQAVRTNRIRLKDGAQVVSDAREAIEFVTGCTIRPHSFSGDPGLISVRIKCL
ncbi:MAG: hypothetical protein GY952_14315, partial [Rhodobacteraceae bacterium]|nr:hypothetical protein [Paracoccaceae bacterium]